MTECNDKTVRALEAVLFAAPRPLDTAAIRAAIPELTPAAVEMAVDRLNTAYDTAESAMRIRRVAGGFQMYVIPEFGGVVERLLVTTKVQRLSRAALETLAVVAYKQPATAPEIERIRGVASDGVLRTLLERNLVAITGRAEKPGRPLLYGTTEEFLRYFGLNDMMDLPKIEELEQILAAREEQRQIDAGVVDVASVEDSESVPADDDPTDGDTSVSEDDTPDASDRDEVETEEMGRRLTLVREPETSRKDVEGSSEPVESEPDSGEESRVTAFVTDVEIDDAETAESESPCAPEENPVEST